MRRLFVTSSVTRQFGKRQINDWRVTHQDYLHMWDQRQRHNIAEGEDCGEDKVMAHGHGVQHGDVDTDAEDDYDVDTRWGNQPERAPLHDHMLNCVTADHVDSVRGPGGSSDSQPTPFHSAPGGSSAMGWEGTCIAAGKTRTCMVTTQRIHQPRTQGESSQMNMTQTQGVKPGGIVGVTARTFPAVPIACRLGYVGSVGQQMSSAHQIRGRLGLNVEHNDNKAKEFRACVSAVPRRLARPKSAATPVVLVRQHCRARRSSAADPSVWTEEKWGEGGEGGARGPISKTGLPRLAGWRARPHAAAGPLSATLAHVASVVALPRHMPWRDRAILPASDVVARPKWLPSANIDLLGFRGDFVNLEDLPAQSFEDGPTWQSEPKSQLNLVGGLPSLLPPRAPSPKSKSLFPPVPIPPLIRSPFPNPSSELDPFTYHPTPPPPIGAAAMVRELRVDSFYARLRAAAASASAAGSSSPLLILPSAADADSLCAVRALAHVLSADSIRFSIYPVASCRRRQGPPRLLLHLFSSSLCLLLVNWGAHRDLRGILPPAATAFVVDSHRPVHLHNLCARNDRVVVLFTADDEQTADLSYDFDLSALADASDLDAEGDADDHLRVTGDASDSDASDSDSDDDGGGGGRRKRRRLSDDADAEGGDPVRLFARLRREYYRLGTFHGKPSRHALRKNTNELLWLACVALTDQFVHDRITNERYQAAVMELEQHINGSGNLDLSGVGSVVTLKDGTKIRAPETSRIAYEDEPRLMLLREWSLFDSMLCSSYVATKLKTWSDNGLKKLKLLLARMGFPLADCQKNFQYMSMEVKRKMRDELTASCQSMGSLNSTTGAS
ncbi:hypothetical protein HU200_049966 [Digitaria exilis]|uniref:CDC45-like protein n=1 Tax=Digitaria exilis TaxID=1010633 RepID=A0A835APH1_9POAL|nr:hypothetical protein HU200_049966 [Digitaria exilis]